MFNLHLRVLGASPVLEIVGTMKDETNYWTYTLLFAKMIEYAQKEYSAIPNEKVNVPKVHLGDNQGFMYAQVIFKNRQDAIKFGQSVRGLFF